jgi:restriction endonuclease S subunit
MYGATIGRLGILGIAASVNQACCAFSQPSKFETKFVFYWLLMWRPILISLSTGGGQPNLSQDELRRLRIPAPPLSEQRSIANFLDCKTAPIDSLIRKKEELIEKLQEKRTALISRTVTRGLPPDAAKAAGLDPHPKMKDTGIEWLCETPEHCRARNHRV